MPEAMTRSATAKTRPKTKKGSDMGQVWQDLAVSNELDVGKAREGTLPKNQVRKVVVRALVDTGATMLALPREVIRQLGLFRKRTVPTLLGDGKLHRRTVWSVVTVRALRREAVVEVVEAPPGVPPLLGQLPLEALDLLVDTKAQRLVPNPASPDPKQAVVYML
ncbi:MAG: retroviral-like aspartic protease family protein [Planctomycetota bacterium]|nr:retroviral-like aspartic protease family protein [Planctomycetota bacterium]